MSQFTSIRWERVAKRATMVTILADRPDDVPREAVETAVRYCPTHGLRIEEDD